MYQIRSNRELVRTANVVSSQQTAVLRVVRNLAAFNGVLIVLADHLRLGFAKMPIDEIVPLVLMVIFRTDPGGAAGDFHPCVA